LSFPAIAIGGHLSVSVGDRLVCGVWRRAPSGEQASKPLSDSRQQPFCNFVSKVVRGTGNGPDQTVEMGTKPQNSRALPQIGKMPTRSMGDGPLIEVHGLARGFARGSTIECRNPPGILSIGVVNFRFDDDRMGDSVPRRPSQSRIRMRRAIDSIDLLANLADVGVDTGVQRPIPTIRLIRRRPKRMGRSADR
jgi:hypothetical protein